MGPNKWLTGKSILGKNGRYGSILKVQSDSLIDQIQPVVDYQAHCLEKEVVKSVQLIFSPRGSHRSRVVCPSEWTHMKNAVVVQNLCAKKY